MKGADRVACQCPESAVPRDQRRARAEGLPSLVTLFQESGWRVVVFSTPMGTRFADLDELERLTGQPVRWEYRMPGTGERTPPADAVLACPLTFNSVNKFAHGHADNFAVGPAVRDGRLRGAGGRGPALQAAAGVAPGVHGEPGDAARHGGTRAVRSGGAV